MKKAAIYARCSTDMQDQSISDQIKAIRDYAGKNGFCIVEDAVFVDEGKSGVMLKHRAAFNKMIKEIESGKAEFNHVLVYDVSRFGRFRQDDEAAYWDFHCRKHGVLIAFTNEAFTNDNSLANSLLKNLKRSMASEYSRKLAQDVTRGLKSNASKGYWNGSKAPYGFHRAMVDEQGKIIRVLEFGDRKGIRDMHLKLIPGVENEVKLVREIYELYDKGLGVKQITNELNRRKIPSPTKRKWNASTVHKVLTNPIYIGTMRWGRTQNGTFSSEENSWNDKNPFKTLHDKEKVVVVENAFQPLIEKELFERVQKTLAGKRCFKESSDGRPYGSNYLATGLLVCSNCGSRYKGRTFLRPQRGKALHYYWCAGNEKNGKEFCKQYPLHRIDVDSFLVEEVLRRVNDAGYLAKVDKIVRQRLENNFRNPGESERIDEEIKKNDQAIDSLLVELEEFSVEGKQMIRERIQKRIEAKKNLLRRKQNLDADKNERKAVDEQMIQLKTFMKEIDARILSAEITDDVRETELRKKVIRSFIHHGVVNRETNTVDFYFFKKPSPVEEIPLNNNTALSTRKVVCKRVEHDLVDHQSSL